MSEWMTVSYGDVTSNIRTRAQANADSEQLLSVTAANGVIGQSHSGRRDISAADKSNYLVVEPGDVVYNTMRMWQGVSGFSEMRGIVSPAYTVLRPSERALDGRFLAHLMKLPSNIRKYRSYSQGLVSDTWNLKFGVLSDLELKIPPLGEQRRIAEVLDTIEATIRASVRVIAKLRLQLRGATNDLLKIGQDWNHGTVGSLLAAIDTGKSPVAENRPPGPAEWGVLKVSAVHSEGFRPQEVKAVPSALIRRDDEVRHGDVLMTRANTTALVGMCCYVDSPPPRLQLSDKTLRLIPNSRVYPTFLVLLLQSQSVRDQIERDGTGSSGSMKNISQQEIRSLTVSWPAKQVQEQILDSLGAIVNRIRTETECVAKLQRTRSGLANDLLSGRVRTVAA
ncbi:MAG: restriction endonuclease subunit S [bacterium]|nr:restriction endonuclease subunit S [bacterium]